MCLTIADNHGYRLRANTNVDIKKYLYTAKEDITVYKIIKNDNTSMYQDFQYKPNTQYCLGKNLKPWDLICIYFEVDEGFHAYLSKRFTPDKKLVEFVIPKGAKYFLGINNDIVSDSIKSGDLKNLIHSL